MRFDEVVYWIKIKLKLHYWKFAKTIIVICSILPDIKKIKQN